MILVRGVRLHMGYDEEFMIHEATGVAEWNIIT